MPPSSFTNKKELMFTIALGTGSFGSSSGNAITLQGLRASVRIDKAGGQMAPTLRAQIYGVSQSHIAQLTVLQWKPNFLIKNTIQVYAIDGSQQTLVFQGLIVNAWGMYQGMPDVFLQIQAQGYYSNQLEPVAPLSYKGGVDVATVMKQITAIMGNTTFENNGVTAQLTDVYLPGTALDQAKSLANAAGCWLYLDDGVLAITPINTARNKTTPVISPQSGLMGYPTFDGVGVNFRSVFNPGIVFGGPIQIVSSIPQASKQWIVTSISHTLESEKPGGMWLSEIRGNSTGLVAP